MPFEDRLVEYPNRYTMTDASGNTSTVYLDPDPGEVTQEGTMLNAETLNAEIAWQSLRTPQGFAPTVMGTHILEISSAEV